MPALILTRRQVCSTEPVSWMVARWEFCFFPPFITDFPKSLRGNTFPAWLSCFHHHHSVCSLTYWALYLVLVRDKSQQSVMSRQEGSKRIVRDITTEMSSSVHKWTSKTRFQNWRMHFDSFLGCCYQNSRIIMILILILILDFFNDNWSPKKRNPWEKKASLRHKSVTFTVNRTVADPVKRDFYLLPRSDRIRPKRAKKNNHHFQSAQMIKWMFLF